MNVEANSLVVAEDDAYDGDGDGDEEDGMYGFLEAFSRPTNDPVTDFLRQHSSTVISPPRSRTPLRASPRQSPALERGSPSPGGGASARSTPQRERADTGEMGFPFAREDYIQTRDASQTEWMFDN